MAQAVVDIFKPVKIKEKDGKLYAPGIGDDTRGLAELLSMIRALNATNIKTVGECSRSWASMACRSRYLPGARRNKERPWKSGA